MLQIKQYPILVFFLLALLISWAGWIPYAAVEANLLDWIVPAEVIWIAEFGPSLAALVITFWLNGKQGLKKLWIGLTKWKVKYFWYVFAILLTPAIILLTLAISSVFTGISYDLANLSQWDTNFITRTEAFTPSLGIISGISQMMKNGPLATAFFFLLLSITNGGLSEEIGWRGFALDRWLENKRGLLISSFFVSILWAFWHTGTLFWKTILTTNLQEASIFAITYLFQYMLLVFPLSILYTILYEGSGRSILLAVLFHAFYNISIAVFATALPNFPMLTFVLVLWVLAGGSWFIATIRRKK